MKPNKTVSELKQGDGSEFNSSFSYLERMHNCLVIANTMSIRNDYNSFITWLRALEILDRELSPSYNDKDLVDIKKVRVNRIIRHQNIVLDDIRSDLNTYELELRRIHTEKGFNVKAKEDMGGYL